MKASFACFQARLDTFAGPKTKGRRPSARSKKQTANPGAWPLEAPSAYDLAFAGFYYKPTSESPDNVHCNTCNCSLDGWEASDFPAHEHLTHAPTCGFAINVNIRLRHGDPSRVEDDPTTEVMEAARRQTFGDEWPLDTAAGFPGVDQLVAAGWCFDPTTDTPDGVVCPYCTLSLDSWDAGDDPAEEHRRRAPDCLFFALQEMYHPSESQNAGTKQKATRGKRASSRSSTSSRTGKKAEHKAPRKNTRTKKAAAKEAEPEPEAGHELEPEPEPEPQPQPQPQPKTVAQRSVVPEEIMARLSSPPKLAPPPKKRAPTRKASKRVSTLSTASTSTRQTRGTKRTSDELDLEPLRPAKTRESKRTKRVTDETEMQLEPETEPAFAPQPQEHSARATRSKYDPKVDWPSMPSDLAQSTPQPTTSILSGTPETVVPKAKTPKAKTPEPRVHTPEPKTKTPVHLARTPQATTPENAAEEAQWEPIDIDSVLERKDHVVSFFSNVIVDAGLDKENIDVVMKDADSNVRAAVDAVKSRLTTDEKKMTVEQWILYNAKRGAEKLRAECERQVSAFDVEGKRALATLDAVPLVNSY